MRRVERIGSELQSRPVLAVFLTLAAVPMALAVLSFRPIALPTAVLSSIELLFWLLVYLPISALRRLLLAPLGLDGLFTFPGVRQAAIVVTLLGFYYCLSVGLVRLGTALRHRIERRTADRRP